MSVLKDYSHILSDESFTWSYSNITTFEDCKYKWFLRYIYGVAPDEMFFAQFGSFMHEIHRLVYEQHLNKHKTIEYYCNNYFREVTAKAPSDKIASSYFASGLSYWSGFDYENVGEVLSVEEKVEFDIDGVNFVGYIDLIKNDDGIEIVDHKSRRLSQYSKKRFIKPLKKDIELDLYYRQLYLYAKPVIEKYGELPKWMTFNCFRSGEVIKNKFDEDFYFSTMSWASDLTKKITSNRDWSPSISEFKCRNICEFCNKCDYFRLFSS